MTAKTPEKDEPLAISVPAAGRRLGLGKNLSYAAAARGDIPVIKIGGRLIVPVAALKRMLEAAASVFIWLTVFFSWGTLA